MNKKCLNCDKSVRGNFCSNCGQKTSVHRFSLRYFFSDGIIKGFYHLDKKVFYTAKQLLVNPGHSAREYIQGKRARHLHFLTFATIILVIDFLFSYKLQPYFFNTDPLGTDDLGLALGDFLENNAKNLNYGIIPLLSISSYFFFNKSNQFFGEHLVLNTFLTSGQSLIYLPIYIIEILIQDNQNEWFGIIYLVYMIWFNIQYFSIYGYSKISLILRVIVHIIFSLFIASLFFFIAFEFSNDGKTYIRKLERKDTLEQVR